jgi:F-type H+-transporting ATPase subunit b
MEILQLFGVDWKLMLAQVFNFIIVLAVLWRFALKPLNKTMEARNKEIAQGLDDAKNASQRLHQVEQEAKEQINKAKQEAMFILEKANTQAEASRKTASEKTKQEVAVLITKAKEQIEAEKDMLVQEARQDLSKLLVEALEKILTKGVSQEIDKKYLQAIAKELKHESR